AMELGYRLGRRYRISGPERAPGAAALEASGFGLMGLLLAFTFNGAATRFEARRGVMVGEGNAVGTAYLRFDLLPAEVQPKLRECFRTYLQSRLTVARKIPDLKAARAELARSEALQQELWREAVAGTQASSAPTRSFVLGSINEMIDITTESTV